MAGQTIQISVLADTRRFSRAMQNLSRNTGLSKLGQVFKNVGRKAVAFFKSGLKYASLLGTAIAGLAIKGGLSKALDLQKAQATLTGLYGSAKKATKTMEALQKVSSKSSIDNASYNKAAQSLAYAGVEGKKAVTILDHVGKAIVGAGGGSEDLQGASDALLSMVNAGKVQLDSLQQLANANVPILSGLAAHFHTSIDNVNEMASKGKIKLDDVLSVMQKGTGKTWKKQEASAKQVEKTFSATFSRMKDSALTAIGKNLVPLLNKLAPILEKIGKSFGKWLTDTAIPAIKDLAKWVGDNLWPVLQNFGKTFADKIVPAVKDFASELISTAVPVIKTLWTNFKQNLLPAIENFAQTLTDTLWPALKSIWKSIKDNVLPVLMSIAKTIIDKVYPAILDIASAIVKNVLPVLADLWKSFTENVMPSLQHLWNVISTKVLPILISLAKFIATKVVPVLLHIAGPILKVVFKALGKLIDILADVIAWLADHLVPGARKAFQFVADKATWLWEKGIKPAFHFIKHAAGQVSDKFWTVVHGIRDAFKWVKEKILSAVGWIVDKFLWLAEKIIDAAAKAFGWVPGLGGKLKSASKHFKTFRQKVNKELGRIKDRDVKLNLKTSGLGTTVGLLGGPKLIGPNGKIYGKAAGGTVTGQRAPYGDKVLTALAPGEEVITNRHGQADRFRPLLKAINAGRIRGLADGGTTFGVSTGGLGSTAANFATLRQSFNAMTAKVIKKVVSSAQAALDAGSLVGGGSGVARWRGVAMKAMRVAGLPARFLPLLMHRMQVESGGNPRAVNNWDINAWLGHPSKGLMQTIGPTFNAYAGRYRGLGIFNPFANIYAAIMYTLSRYGLAGIARAWGGSGGYATGTPNAAGGWKWVGEHGPELMRVPAGSQILDHRTSERTTSQQDRVVINNTITAPTDKAKDIVDELSWALRTRSMPGVYGRA